jgi:hypothetical protein
MWSKCRQRRLPLCSTFLKGVPPSEGAVKKNLDGGVWLGHPLADGEIEIPFCPRSEATSERAFSLKQQRCPRCGCAESLNRHSFLYGKDLDEQGKEAKRGQRVFCSDRGRRGGCGKTFSIFLAEVLPRHSCTALLLGQLVVKLLAGDSVKAAVESLRLPLALESIYHLLGRLRRRLDAVRCSLCRRQAPAASSQKDPLLQTVEHLQRVFPVWAVSEFQVIFQQPFLS